MSTIWPPYAIFALEVSQPPHQETVIHYIAIRDCIHSHTDTPSEQLDSAPVGTLHLHCNLVIRVDLILCCQAHTCTAGIVSGSGAWTVTNRQSLGRSVSVEIHSACPLPSSPNHDLYELPVGVRWAAVLVMRTRLGEPRSVWCNVASLSEWSMQCYTTQSGRAALSTGHYNTHRSASCAAA
ncbi:hypothetical protein RRG08_015438 [Elysia crispata]|uniref:Uncharacterized protein n=1 Tax=Elysia crispata TaxID=231223 RepID=A0AAE1CZE1_9GAST|nr:hypothetical protein RRG08_015438 [Elysia crispata]